MIARHLSSAVPKTSVGSFSRIGGSIGRDGSDARAVDFVKLAGAGGGRTSHAGEAVVAQKVILHGDAGGLVRGERNFDAFLGFDGLVDAGPPLAAFAEAAGEFVDDDDFAIADDVLTIEKHFARDFDRPLDVLVDGGERHAVQGFGLLQLADFAAAGER